MMGPLCEGENCACLMAAQELLELLKGRGLRGTSALRIHERLPTILVLPCVSVERLMKLEVIMHEEIAKRIAAVKEPQP